VCAEVSTVLRAVAAKFSLTVGVWRFLRITVFGTYQGASTVMRKAFDWKRSRISMLEVEAVPQSCAAVKVDQLYLHSPIRLRDVMLN
jgi:hypothetical protein